MRDAFIGHLTPHAVPLKSSAYSAIMPLENLRRSVRALIVDDSDRLLLGRHTLVDPPGSSAVWAAPGGGVEGEESDLEALRRELREEVGLVVENNPPLVWRHVMRSPDLSTGYDGVANEYFLVRTSAFNPRGGLSDAELANENLEEMRWWSIADLANYRGSDLFSPRDLKQRFSTLLDDGVPDEPTSLTL